jgi:hypothetical protein
MAEQKLRGPARANDACPKSPVQAHFLRITLLITVTMGLNGVEFGLGLSILVVGLALATVASVALYQRRRVSLRAATLEPEFEGPTTMAME